MHPTLVQAVYQVLLKLRKKHDGNIFPAVPLQEPKASDSREVQNQNEEGWFVVITQHEQRMFAISSNVYSDGNRTVC
jgi:hypothetical protein